MIFDDRLQIAIEEKKGIVQENNLPGTAGLYEKIDSLLIKNARRVDTVNIYYQRGSIIVDGIEKNELKLSDFGINLNEITLSPARLIYYISDRYEYCRFMKRESIEVDDYLSSSKNSGVRITFIYSDVEKPAATLKERIREVKNDMKDLEIGNTWKMEIKASVLAKSPKIDTELLMLVVGKQKAAYIQIRGNRILLKTEDTIYMKEDFFKNSNRVWEIEMPNGLNKKGIFQIKEQNMIGQEIFEILTRYYREQGLEIEIYEYSKKNLMSLVSFYNIYKFKINL